MPLDANRDDLKVGICGAGAMGRGIVQVTAAGGVAVKLFDINAEQCAQAVKFIEQMLSRQAEKGQITAEQLKAIMGRIEVVDSMAGFADCHVVIEAATENLDIKRKIFAAIEDAVPPDAIVATNTSSLSVTTIASSCKHPERIAGLHFFNPVPLMKLVEVIEAVRTEPWVGDALMVLGRRMTREPVRLTDAPGFLVNQVGRGYNIEASHIANEQVADPVDLDRILREGAGFRMGPFELMDLTALDVTHPATELIYRQFYEEARFRPSYSMRMRMEAGLLGRKSGRGYYAYPEGKQQMPAEPAPPAYDGRPVWISRKEAACHAALRAIVEKIGAPLDGGETPGRDSLILVTPLGEDVTTCAVEQGLDATRTLGVDTVIGLETRRTVATNPATAPEWRAAAHGLMTADGVKATVTRDCPGLVAQRIVSTICNIGCQIAQFGTAKPEDIDKAVVLGLNYPNGPLTFGDKVGPATVLRILTTLNRLTGDPRYRPSPWLRRRAQLGLSLFATEI